MGLKTTSIKRLQEIPRILALIYLNGHEDMRDLAYSAMIECDMRINLRILNNM